MEGGGDGQQTLSQSSYSLLECSTPCPSLSNAEHMRAGQPSLVSLADTTTNVTHSTAEYIHQFRLYLPLLTRRAQTVHPQPASHHTGHNGFQPISHTAPHKAYHCHTNDWYHHINELIHALHSAGRVNQSTPSSAHCVVTLFPQQRLWCSCLTLDCLSIIHFLWPCVRC